MNKASFIALAHCIFSILPAFAKLATATACASVASSARSAVPTKKLLVLSKT